MSPSELRIKDLVRATKQLCVEHPTNTNPGGACSAGDLSRVCREAAAAFTMEADHADVSEGLPAAYLNAWGASLRAQSLSLGPYEKAMFREFASGQLQGSVGGMVGLLQAKLRESLEKCFSSAVSWLWSSLYLSFSFSVLLSLS